MVKSKGDEMTSLYEMLADGKVFAFTPNAQFPNERFLVARDPDELEALGEGASLSADQCGNCGMAFWTLTKIERGWFATCNDPDPDDIDWKGHEGCGIANLISPIDETLVIC